jgi:penicillin-binding protein-related factor A (putative recombinase)
VSATNWRNNGKAFEEALTRTCEYYESRRLMRVRKVDPPTIVVKGKVIMLKNPFLDFVGTWTECNGRAIMFEAKSTSKPVLPFGSSGVSDAQLEAMRQWQAAGAIVFVLWQHGDMTRLLTWKTFNCAETGVIDKPRKHIKLTDGWIVRQGDGFALHDFRLTLKLAAGLAM